MKEGITSGGASVAASGMDWVIRGIIAAIVVSLVAGLLSMFMRATNNIDGNKQSKTIEQSLTTVEQVEMGIPGTATVVAAETASVKITGDQNIVDCLAISHADKKLKVTQAQQCEGKLLPILRPGLPLEVTISVTASDLERVANYGSGTLSVAFSMTKTPSTIDQYGSGTVSVTLDNERASATVSGSGKLVLAGKTQDFSITHSGSGTVEGTIATVNTQITSTGSGNVTVAVEKTLNASVKGSGSIFYRGNPTVTSQITGSGKIQKIQ